MSETIPPSPDSPPGKRRLLNWRNARRLLITAAVGVTLIAVVFTVENWRGQRAWRSFVADMKARGEPLTVDELLPAMPPDGENIAEIPLLKPLLDYGKNDHGTNAWRNPAAYARLVNPPFPDTRLCDRESQRLTDFTAWQSAFRSDTNHHAPTTGLSAPIVVTNDSVSGLTEIRYDTNHAVREVLLYLAAYDANMNALHAAEDLPHIRFPIHYDEGFSALLPHLQAMRHFSRIAVLKASAFLAENRPADALRELFLAIRLSEAADAEPLLISQLVRVAMLNMTTDVVWEGMQQGRWQETQLRKLEARLRGLDMTRAYAFSMRGERALALHGLELVRNQQNVLGDDSSEGRVMEVFHFGPSGWYQHNIARLGRMFDEFAFPYVVPEKRRFYISEGREKSKELDARIRASNIYNIMASLLMPAYSKVIDRMAYCQVTTDQLRIAAAVERFRLAKGHLPQGLADLGALLETPVPVDPTNGEAYRYQADREAGTYRIWSPGADGKDDGGRIEWDEQQPDQPDRESGDWVWEVTGGR